MPSRTIQELSEKIKNASIGKAEREELVKLIDSLKNEIEELSTTNQEHAESIANFAEARDIDKRTHNIGRRFRSVASGTRKNR